MSPDATQLRAYERLRRDVGEDSSTLSDTDAIEITAEAAELYANLATARVACRVIALLRLTARSARQIDVAEGTDKQTFSQLFTHRKELLDYWQTQLDKAIQNEQSFGTNSGASQSIRVPVISVW